MSEPLRFPDEPRPEPPESPAQRSFRTLVMEAIGNVQEILRSEVRLAIAELSEDFGRLGKAAVFAVGGGLALLFGVGLILLAAVFALALVMPLWASALVIGAVVSAVAGGMLAAGIARIRRVRSLKPEKAISSVKETAQWARDRIR